MGISEAHRPVPISSSPSPPSLFRSLTLVLALVFSFISPAPAADLYALVYKGCANQTFGGGAASQQALITLTSSLTAHAATAKFYKTSSSSSAGGQALFGLYQCRGDLSPSDCSACVGRAVSMWSYLCGLAVAARVHLTGCYALYQVSGFPQVSGTQMLFKTCGSGGGGGGDFELKRDTAFSQLQSGVAGGAGFYVTSYASVYAMAQCEGDLSTGDCGDCVSQAVQKSEVECGGASSGQVYLDKSANREDRGDSGGRGSGSGVSCGLLDVCQESNEEERWFLKAGGKVWRRDQC
ncbi:plasmodesmata-located protein 2 [Cocos nucifera]|uniref:Plasmodesmata-located protein 2 n=1 Tax=Cocos nucifera TaxID=13894 RepID=A0A8K0IED5_COCNU|nr:plasmodesmata-located protein 2 [Cocos nucifera]